MKILVIAGRYGISGVPLAQMRFARALAARGHEVDLAFGMLNPGEELPSVANVRVFTFGTPRVSQMLMPLKRYFDQSNPDLVFSAGDHLNVFVLFAAILARSRAKISCSSRVTPFDTYSKNPLRKGWLLKRMMHLTMWRANALTCVSSDMVGQYQKLFRRSRFVCAYNIIDDESSRARMDAPVQDEWLVNKTLPVVIAAGSLVPWKGFSDLIEAMSQVVTARKARLIVLGEGPMRQELLRLATERGLTDCVKLPGNVSNPLAYFSRSDVFVLSSYVEGLPNVLVEAMLCGCTPVSTNCPTGPREVLQDGKYGHLVPMRDPSALAAAIVRALDAPISNDELAGAISNFREEAVIRRHLELLGIDAQPGPTSSTSEEANVGLV